MSKKDYEKVAAMLRGLLLYNHREHSGVFFIGWKDAILACAREMSDNFESHNPQFDVERFMDAVLPDQQKVAKHARLTEGD